MTSPYLRLIRLHQPIGIWLLMWPCWWAIALASDGLPSLSLLILFALGAALMRSAGCIINDMADRKLDQHVKRTATRPLASGELSMWQAGTLLAALIFCSALIAFYLGKVVVMWAALALVPVVIYPFMKRISWWPQLFLGLTFNWGVLIGWAAVRGVVEAPALWLYAGGIVWTIGYDTLYAHQDKIDDARIGIKSTALRLGKYTKKAVAIFYITAASCWLTAGLTSRLQIGFFFLLFCTFLQLMWQIKKVEIDNPASCRKAFFANNYIGLLLFLAILLG